MSFEIGQVIWAKSGKDPYWPAWISDLKKKEKKYFVIYLSENSKGWVREQNICNFKENILDKQSNPTKPSFAEAVKLGNSLSKSSSFMEQEDYKAAIDEIEQIEKVMKFQEKFLTQNVRENIYYEYAKYMVQQQDFNNALSLISKAQFLTLNSNKVEEDIFITKGEILFNMKLFQEAEDHYLESIKQFPECIPLLINLGEVYQKQQLFKKAEEYFNKALEIDPDFEDTYISQGCLFLEIKNYTKALESFDQALEMDPKNPLILLNKAEALNCMGLFKEAVECMDQIELTYTSEDIDYYQQLIIAYDGQKKFKLIIECLEIMKTLDIENSAQYEKQIQENKILMNKQEDDITPQKYENIINNNFEAINQNIHYSDDSTVTQDNHQIENNNNNKFKNNDIKQLFTNNNNNISNDNEFIKEHLINHREDEIHNMRKDSLKKNSTTSAIQALDNQSDSNEINNKISGDFKIEEGSSENNKNQVVLIQEKDFKEKNNSSCQQSYLHMLNSQLIQEQNIEKNDENNQKNNINCLPYNKNNIIDQNQNQKQLQNCNYINQEKNSQNNFQQTSTTINDSQFKELQSQMDKLLQQKHQSQQKEKLNTIQLIQYVCKATRKMVHRLEEFQNVLENKYQYADEQEIIIRSIDLFKNIPQFLQYTNKKLESSLDQISEQIQNLVKAFKSLIIKIGLSSFKSEQKKAFQKMLVHNSYCLIEFNEQILNSF